MTWSYSGDPASSELDRYRFTIGDTDTAEPVLKDEEINFILASYTSHYERLYHLYDNAAQYFARRVSRKLGPQSEFTSDRQKHFETKAEFYRQQMQGSFGLSLPKSSASIFTKGMHDNV
jgi:hypothetical protein